MRPGSGSFTFPTLVTSGSVYAVTVGTQPTGQTCTVSNGTGTANASVTNVTVTCTDNFVNPVPTLSDRAHYVLALTLLLAGGWHLRRVKDRG
jgi:hypothetical protein